MHEVSQTGEDSIFANRFAYLNLAPPPTFVSSHQNSDSLRVGGWGGGGVRRTGYVVIVYCQIVSRNMSQSSRNGLLAVLRHTRHARLRLRTF